MNKPAFFLFSAPTCIQSGIDVDDENAMYPYKSFNYMIWSYDEECRLMGEDVWEPDPSSSEIIKLDPVDVVTAEDARVRLVSLHG
jgi:hypothetical protein